MDYFVNFENDTDRVWTMGVYQKFPDSPGLDSVSWKQTTAPSGGNTGVKWEVLYNVALANYIQEGGRGVYKASQVLPTDLGSEWDIVFEQGVQQLKRVGRAPLPNQVIINNKSQRIANPGIGMDGEGAVFQHDMNSGASSQFIVTPVYYMGLFNSLIEGEVIRSNVIVGPFDLKFLNDFNAANVRAFLVGSEIRVSIDYSNQFALSQEAVSRRIHFQESLVRAAGAY